MAQIISPKVSPGGSSYPKFSSLQTSIKTIMVYTNMEFDIAKIFEEIPITEIDVPYTKRNKKIDKKRIVAPYGAIFSTQRKKDIRGVDVRQKLTKKKKPKPGNERTKVRKVNEKKIDHFLNQIMIDLSIGYLNLNIMMFKDSFKIAGQSRFKQRMTASSGCSCSSLLQAGQWVGNLYGFDFLSRFSGIDLTISGMTSPAR